MDDIKFFVGRQPIMDRTGSLFGYELLFRGGYQPNVAIIESANSATAEVLDNSMMGIGLDQLVGNKKAFINFPQAYFSGIDKFCFAKDNVVIEVLEDVEPTEEVVRTLRDLKSHGYIIALDDFVFKKKFIPFIQLADIIKFDIQGVKLENIKPLFQNVKKMAQCKILAERVETRDQFQHAAEAGADYFQGYYFAKPEIISGQKLGVGQLSLLRLMEKIVNPNIPLEQLVEVIEADVALSHKMMTIAKQYRTAKMPRFVNLSEVVVLFGLKRVQSWAAMLSMTKATDVVPEVFNMALMRAAFMRKYAEKERLKSPDSFYLAGLFSLLDVILKVDLPSALEKLPLEEHLSEGILNEVGEIGKALNIAKRFEAQHHQDVTQFHRAIYFESMQEVAQATAAS